MSEVRIPYRTPPKQLLGYGIPMILLAMFAIDKAAHNDKGLIINHIITLSKDQATAFHWVMASFLSLIVLLAIPLGIISIILRQEIILRDDTISIPKIKKSINIKYSDIINIKIHNIYKTQQLHIIYRGGKVIISSALLPSMDDMVKIVNLIGSKTNYPL